MIPKIIHYCWFGSNKKPKRIQNYMKTWEKCKNYKIIEWSEENCNVKCNSYVDKAYKSGNYAFVSDYFRIMALKNIGGIYLDTDVEIYNSFDKLLHLNAFMGYMFDSLIGTAVLGFEKNHPFLDYILELYDGAEWTNESYTSFKVKLCNRGGGG